MNTKCTILFAILHIALCRASVSIQMPVLGSAGVTYINGQTPQGLVASPVPYAGPKYNNQNSPQYQPSITYSNTDNIKTEVPVFVNLPVRQIDDYPSATPSYQNIPHVVNPVIKTRKYEVRRPAIQNQFYDIVERVIVRPVGSTLIELEHPISKTRKGNDILTPLHSNRNFPPIYYQTHHPAIPQHSLHISSTPTPISISSTPHVQYKSLNYDDVDSHNSTIIESYDTYNDTSYDQIDSDVSNNQANLTEHYKEPSPEEEQYQGTNSYNDSKPLFQQQNAQLLDQQHMQVQQLYQKQIDQPQMYQQQPNQQQIHQQQPFHQQQLHQPQMYQQQIHQQQPNQQQMYLHQPNQEQIHQQQPFHQQQLHQQQIHQQQPNQQQIHQQQPMHPQKAHQPQMYQQQIHQQQPNQQQMYLQQPNQQQIHQQQPFHQNQLHQQQMHHQLLDQYDSHQTNIEKEMSYNNRQYMSVKSLDPKTHENLQSHRSDIPIDQEQNAKLEKRINSSPVQNGGIFYSRQNTPTESHNNQQKFIELLTSNNGHTEIDFGDHARTNSNDGLSVNFIRGRVLSAISSPTKDDLNKERVNTRRVIISRPIETVQEVDVIEPATNYDMYTINHPTGHSNQRLHTSLPPYAFPPA